MLHEYVIWKNNQQKIKNLSAQLFYGEREMVFIFPETLRFSSILNSSQKRIYNLIKKKSYLYLAFSSLNEENTALNKEFKPTPVSSLLHAATLVTAGVYLLIRSSPLLEFSPTTLFFITIMGALTTLFAATSGMLQNDLKRIIAFSTISQLGYIFIAIGLN